MPKRKSSRERTWLPLLGGSALFGYLGCVPQGTSPANEPLAVRPDSTAPVAVKPDSALPVVVVRLDSVRPPDSVFVPRKGPTLGEACARPDSDYSYACTPDGVPVRCFEGKVIPGPGPQVSATRCQSGDTLVHYFHMGFNGIEKAGAHPRPDWPVRRRTA